MEMHQVIKYLGNDCSASERKEVEAWADSSEENQKLFFHLKEMWEATQKTPEAIQPNFEKAWRNIKAQTGIKDRYTNQTSMKLTVQHLLRIAAFLAIVLSVGVATYYSFFSSPSVKTEMAQSSCKKEIQLDDGSVVTLNRNSRITFPEKFNADAREVKLEGEAFFKVTKDFKHPFIVHANGTIIKVLGTSFNIKIKEDEMVQVSVLTGKVIFQPENSSSRMVQLEKGDQGSFDNITKQLSKQRYTDENFLAWETNTLVFNNKPLDEVVKVMSEYYSISIEIQPELQTRSITVTFNNQSLSEALEILKMTLNIETESINDRIILKPLIGI